nr:zinc finger, CCHC-type [Tanacetum cinerariifolium]
MRTHGDYSRPSHKGYRNTIELPDGNNVVPLRSDTIRLVQNECSFHGLCGPHETKYCLENPEQASVEYAFSRTDESGGLVSSFMASRDARLSKFEANFKQQQGEMTNKIDTFLKAINDRMTRALPSDMVKNPKLNVNFTYLVLSARSNPMEDPQCSSHIYNSINAIKMCSTYNIRLTNEPDIRNSPITTNSSSLKRVHSINTITILSKEDKPRETWIVKPNTKDNDYGTIVKVEEESKESKKEGKEEKDNP